MAWSRRSRPRRYGTPFNDLLDMVTRWEPMPTWNRDRGHRGMDGKRKPGGEWDFIRSMPLRQRRRLTSAGYMAKHGMGPDEFAGLIRERAPGMSDKGDTECLEWYVRLAEMALVERRRAEHNDRHLAYARANGALTYYQLRDKRARDAGFLSYWHQRKEARASGT